MNIKKHYDVVIVGAGPAGLMAAKVLAEGGKDVVVFEKNKVVGKKVCGGGITESGLMYGIPERVIERSFFKVRMESQRQSQLISREGGKVMVVTVKRTNLGLWQMNETQKAGAKVLLGQSVNSISREFVEVGGKKVTFDYLIGADGATSMVRKFIGLQTDEMHTAFHYLVKGNFEDMVFYTDPSRFGFTYQWIFPYKSFASIGTGLDIGRGVQMGSLKAEFLKWLEERGISIKGAKFEAAPINYDYEGHEFGNIFLVGEAGGFTLPLTAEGIYPAFLSGQEIAKKILDSRYESEPLKKYIRLRNLQENILRAAEISDIATEIVYELGIHFLQNKDFTEFAAKILGQ